MAHEIQDDGFHEIQLSGKQLVFLFMATTVVSIVIFLCGVLVGRGVPSLPAAGGDSTEATALDPAAGDNGLGDDAAAPASNQPTPVEGLTYAARLTEKEPRSEKVASAPPPSAVPRDDGRTSPAATSAAPAAAATPTAPEGGFTVQVTALKNKNDADALARRLQSRGYQSYVVAPASGGQVIYKVRVGMNMQRQQADRIMRRLQSEEKFKPWITR